MSKPAKDTVVGLVDAINRADLEGAIAHYEKDAVLIAQPGQIARGKGQVKTSCIARRTAAG